MINKPKVSVIVTTYNEEKNIKAFCESVKSQDYENTELVIVDSARSTDKTFEIASKFSDYVFKFGQERSVQRNYGVSKSQGEYVLVLDCDMELTSRVIDDCVDVVLKDPSIKAITIPEESFGNSFWAKCKAFERSFYNLSKDDATDAARFFEKSVFLEFNGYNELLTGAEDWDLPERIYKKYNKKHKIKSFIRHNEGDVSLWKLMKKKHYYGLDAHLYFEDQKISPLGAKTLYFLRPAFYKQWKRWFNNPVISIGTIIMLTGEFIAGGLGFVQGKYINRNLNSKKE